MSRAAPLASRSKKTAAKTARAGAERRPRDRRDKLSISLDPADVRWVTQKARAERTSVSAVLASAIAEQRRAEATARLLSLVGGSADLTPAQLEAARREMLEP